MKAWPVIALLIALGFAGVPRSVAQTTEQKEAPPKYDVANEIKIKGVVDEVKDRYEVVFQKGDEVEIKGIKTTFQGVDAILAREIKRGNDDFVFRDPQGKAIW
jgi:DNA/RNA endonuclease YhcR with UshA esterase domain